MAGLVLTYETFNNLLLLGFFDEGSTRDSSKEQRRENFVKANKRETFYKLGADLLISYDFIRNRQYIDLGLLLRSYMVFLFQSTI